MNEFSLPAAMLIPAVTVIVTLAGSYALVRYRVDRVETRAEQAESRAAGLERNLAEYKLEVAQRFVTRDTLEKVEDRVLEAISRLGDRLDRLLDPITRKGPDRR